MADAYTCTSWFDKDTQQIIKRTWQWVCHVEKTREPGAFITVDIAGHPIAIVRDKDGELRAFYNVCKHRAHHLLTGEGTTSRITCPYHAWTYKLDGQLLRAPHTENMKSFKVDEICLDQVKVEEFCGFVFVNLDPAAAPLTTLSGDLQSEVLHWAPDVDQLTFGHRLSYDIKSNWKNVVDNFLECYHCPVAHKDFCDLVDMDTPGRSSMIVLNIIPVSADRTLETYDFYLETPEPDAMELDAIRYLDEVLQVEDINLVESVQKGMNTPAFNQGRIINDPDGSGKSEHALHHFHGLVLDAYAGGHA